uniref:Diels-Alderase phm7 n=2 Tax=Pyrenochaetopsis sp. TaxID=1756125 RepID=PHM7_PYRSX|nr:RecName: Full=Diels-Alderase phm7; AltName: Full=Phomasetin biosynthesis cluster protein 7 [Pyrenochaetopsis sp.]BBC43190.1 Diels-Alderase [Pyrenochaetopsis sp.]
MSEPTSSSSLDITSNCIIETPLQPSDFLPKSANLFPKFPERISVDSWELWEFDTFDTNGSVAFGCSLYRDARGVEQGGFHAEVNALWPDGTHWGETLYFAVSEVVENSDGTTGGKWLSKDGGSITFHIASDYTAAALDFNVPGKVSGTMELRNHANVSPTSNLPASDAEAQLCPGVYYTFPMGPVATSVTATFSSVGANGESRELFISSGYGGMVRGWSARPWPTFMNDAYYVVAQVGPYMLQILRTLGSVFVQHKPFAVARLYLDGSLVSAANTVVGDELTAHADDVKGDAVRLTKVQPDEKSQGLSGKFRDGNVGYVLEFAKKDSEHGWTFQISHKRAVWSEPTSAPGPDGTGKSGWIEAISGGAKGENYEGHGFGGQLQIPVP